MNNLQDKNIKDFTTSDTIFIKKMKGGYQIEYLCKFKAFKGGIVTGEVIPNIPNGKPEILTARLTNCYLRGKREYDNGFIVEGSCYWFNKEGKAI